MPSKVRENDWGTVIEITVTDSSGTARNLSVLAPDTLKIVTENPKGTETEITASFKTDGSDGIITATVSEANKFTPHGEWHAWARYSKAGQYSFTTEKVPILVEKT